jgi:hypothetical protein
MGLGGQDGDVGVVRSTSGQSHHCLGIAARSGIVNTNGASHIAQGHRLDEFACAGIRRVHARLHDGIARDRHVGRVHVVVDARSHRPGDTPATHRAVRIAHGRGTKRTRGLGEIEAPAEHQTLLEVTLRLGMIGNARRAIRADAVEEARLRDFQATRVRQAEFTGRPGACRE